MGGNLDAISNHLLELKGNGKTSLSESHDVISYEDAELSACKTFFVSPIESIYRIDKSQVKILNEFLHSLLPKDLEKSDGREFKLQYRRLRMGYWVFKELIGKGNINTSGTITIEEDESELVKALQKFGVHFDNGEIELSIDKEREFYRTIFIRAYPNLELDIEASHLNFPIEDMRIKDIELYKPEII